MYIVSRNLEYAINRLFGNGVCTYEKCRKNSHQLTASPVLLQILMNCISPCAPILTLTHNVVFMLYPKWLTGANYKRFKIVIIPGLTAMQSALCLVQSNG